MIKNISISKHQDYIRRQKNEVTKSHKSLFLIFSCVFICVFALRNIPLSLDDSSYLLHGYITVNRLNLVVSNLSSSWVNFMLDEPIYWSLVYLISEIAGWVYFVPTLTAITCSLVCWSLGKHTKYSLLCLLVFMFFVPIAKNWYLHLRQGLAIGILLYGLTQESNKRYFLIGLAPFVHVSMWVVIATLVIDYWASRIANKRSIYIFVAFCVAIFSFIALQPVLQLTNYSSIRRSYEAVGNTASLVTYAAYITLAIIIWLVSNKAWQSLFYRQFIYGLFIYIALSFSTQYSARIFENYLPLGFISIFHIQLKNDALAYVFMSTTVFLMIAILFGEHIFLEPNFTLFGFSALEVINAMSQ